MERDPLEVDPETMRLLGYQAVDWLVDRTHGRRDEPVLQQASPADMARRVPGTAPASGQGDFAEILRHLGEDVLPFRSRVDHPRYLAYVLGEGTWPGALGDLIASAYNIDVGNWMESAGPSRLEAVVLRWFADWIGYPAEASGVLVSGGSAANLTAMACAREALVGSMSGELVAYVSEQGHSSLARAARVLGFGPQQVRVLPVDDRFRMRTDALDAAITADLAAGRRPLVVLAVAGTTNTGAVDDLPELARVCGRHGVWLHVDGAYGAFAALTERGGGDLRLCRGPVHDRPGSRIPARAAPDHAGRPNPGPAGRSGDPARPGAGPAAPAPAAGPARSGPGGGDLAAPPDPLFAQLPATSLAGLAQSLERVDVEPGETLVREGETGEHYYAIGDGEVTVLQQGRSLTRLARGDGFGEIALMRSVPRTATAMAETQVLAYRLGRDAFLEAVTGHRAVLESAEAVVRGHAARDAARNQPPATES